MWLFFASGSALFAGLTAILSKCGIKHTDSNVATAVRTCVVLIFSWLMVFVAGTQNTLAQVAPMTMVFLILSGLATGASWLCYFRALQMGDVNKVTPIDKSSTVLTMLLAFLFLHEDITLLKGAAMVLIGVGTYLMIEKKKAAQVAGGASEEATGAHSWLWFACGSAIFAALTAILGKIGIEGVDSTLGTAIRTVVVLVMAWVVVFVTGKQNTIKDIDKTSWFFLVLSGLATGGSWLCYYRALQEGPASIVVPIDKLSILVTIAFSYLVFHETLTKKSAFGLLLIVAGTLLLLVK
jgi:transporter family protein